MKYKMLYDNVLIEPDEIIKKSEGGIYIPPDSEDKPSVATVIAVGNGNLDFKTKEVTPLTVKVGDKILYYKNSGVPFNYNEETKKYLIIKEKDIFCIINE